MSAAARALVLGVDGGGSKTRAIVCDEHDRVIAEGHAASSNAHSVGFARATEALTEAVRACSHAGELAAACFGLAGVDREEDRARLEVWARAQGFAPRTVVVNDSGIVLAAGTPAGHGVALVCGTGSVAFGATEDGRQARAGGWGWLMGDEGSGYSLAVEALRAATRAADGRDAAGRALLAAILAAWQLERADDLITRVYAPATTRADVARLAPIVLQLADDGDPAARAIVERGAEEAATLVVTVARALGLDEPPLALAGGLLSAHAGYRAAVCARANVPASRAKVVADPAHGAVVLARKLLAR